MDLVLKNAKRGDLFIDEWLEEFIRTTVQFAVWHAPRRIRSVRVDLRRQLGGEIACELLAVDEAGDGVSASGVDRRAYEAIQTAADRLEVTLFGPTAHSNRAVLRKGEAA